MKNLILILVVLSLFESCKEVDEEAGKSVSTKFEIKNLSSKKLNILLFNSNNFLFRDVEIQTLDSLIIEEGILSPAPSGPTYSLTNSIDSAIIEFSDGKKIIQTIGTRGNNDTINNILLDIYYKNFESFNPNFVRKQFTIMESDYIRAK